MELYQNLTFLFKIEKTLPFSVCRIMLSLAFAFLPVFASFLKTRLAKRFYTLVLSASWCRVVLVSSLFNDCFYATTAVVP